MSNRQQELVDATVRYAEMGWPVFPCHPTGHQPLVNKGFYAATTNVDTIRGWWSRWPDAAIALRTGEQAGAFVVDIDPRHGGDILLEELEAEHGRLPHTVECQTGGGGRHIYLKWPDQQVKCSTGQIKSGIDIKGDGGYVILPPSDHKSGNTYNWLFEHEPGECAVADAPGWLLERIDAGTGAESKHLRAASVTEGDVIPEGHRNNTLLRLGGYLRHVGMDAAEIKAALLARNEFRCRPPLDVKEVERIAESVSRYEPDSARQAEIECWPERYLGNGETNAWPDPLPIPDDLPPVKAFDPVLLPLTLRPWIVDIADRMQCPLDFPAVTSMVALSGILGRKIAIRPKQRDNWTVYPNLWGVLIGRPSLMKSPPMKETLLPIRRMTADALAEYEAAMTGYEAAADLQGIEAKVLRGNIASAMKAGEDTEGLQEQLSTLTRPEKPKRKRYTVNDATVEALGEILADNPNGVIIERDELIGLLKSLERPGQEGARAFYLEGWTGDGSCESDRIGRGNVRIDGFCLSILGTIQPGPLGTYLGEALRGGTGDDGLMQRFQMAVWPDDPGAWQVVDRWPDSDAKDAAYEVYQRFEELPASSIGELPGAFDSNTTPFLRFDADAQDRFYAWMIDRENLLRRGAEHPAVESHQTKYRKLVPALALIIHLAESGGGPVTLDAVTRAVGWADYLESHARRIYSRGIHPATAHARALAQRIEQGDVATGFTIRDVYHGHHWSLLADADQVQLAVDELIELGWLRAETLNTPGRTKVVHHINPKVAAPTP
jgi:putative DNA primase/helicase